MYTGAASGIFHAAGGGGRAIAKLPAVFDTFKNRNLANNWGAGGGGEGGAHSS